MKGKARWAKFDYVNGGREAWLAKVEGLSLGRLTTEVVSLWRNQYIAKAGADLISRKSAECLGASYKKHDTLKGVAERFAQFHKEFAPFFQTKTRDSSEVAGQYLNGLVQASKKNIERME